jgi:hypothetical protein
MINPLFFGIRGFGIIKANKRISPYPIFLSGEVPSGHANTVEITFDRNLDVTSIPAGTTFTLIGSVTGAKTISNTSILGAIVTLIVTVNFSDETVLVSYTQPILNPIKSEEGKKSDSFINQIVTNNLFGPELVQNGNFDIDASWNKAPLCAVIIGGVAKIDNTAGGQCWISQNCLSAIPTLYKVIFTIVSNTGSVRCYVGGNYTINHVGIGTFTENVLSAGLATLMPITLWANTIAEIDNISVKEIL